MAAKAVKQAVENTTQPELETPYEIEVATPYTSQFISNLF